MQIHNKYVFLWEIKSNLLKKITFGLNFAYKSSEGGLQLIL